MHLFGVNIGTLSRVFSFDQDPLLYFFGFDYKSGYTVADLS